MATFFSNQFNDNSTIKDTNNKDLIEFDVVDNAVNHLKFANAAQGGNVVIKVDTNSNENNVGINLEPLGSGNVNVTPSNYGGGINFYNSNNINQNYVSIIAPSTISSSYTLGLPSSSGEVEQIVSLDDSKDLKFSDPKQMFLYCIKDSEEVGTISLGKPVIFSGFSDTYGCPTVKLANNNNSSLMPAFGLALGQITTSAKNKVGFYGEFEGYNTSSYSPNDEIYVGEGVITNSRPTTDVKIQKIAKVITSNTNGKFFIMGAGRSNDIPNLQHSEVFIGNNQGYEKRKLNYSDFSDTSNIVIYNTRNNSNSIVLISNSGVNSTLGIHNTSNSSNEAIMIQSSNGGITLYGGNNSNIDIRNSPLYLEPISYIDFPNNYNKLYNNNGTLYWNGSMLSGGGGGGYTTLSDIYAGTSAVTLTTTPDSSTSNAIVIKTDDYNLLDTIGIHNNRSNSSEAIMIQASNGGVTLYGGNNSNIDIRNSPLYLEPISWPTWPNTTDNKLWNYNDSFNPGLYWDYNIIADNNGSLVRLDQIKEPYNNSNVYAGYYKLNITSSFNGSNAISFVSNGTSGQETIGIYNYHGTTNEAIILNSNSGGITLESSGNVYANTNNFHISSGTTGNCALIIESDTGNDNVIENYNPRIEFRQDGGLTESVIYNDHNELTISNAINSGGIIFKCDSNTGGWLEAPERMRITMDGKIGINNSSPDGLFDIRSLVDSDYVLSMRTSDENGSGSNLGGFFGFKWDYTGSVDYEMSVFMKDDTSPNNYHKIGIFDNNTGSSGAFFTGQHRNLMNININTDYTGLIVSSNGSYVNTNNSLLPSINESLPYLTLTNEDNDKKVFGVISDKEDGSDNRKVGTGSYKTCFTKENINEQRLHINSVGEGALWVCNKNGGLINGDYISSSNIVGYGMKQTDDLLHNYTVAKITCDCNFSLTKVPKQKLSTTTNSNNTVNINYNNDGNIYFIDDLDENNNQQMIYPLETRFVNSNGEQLNDENDYNTRLSNGENVYIACFVGCTYHCG